MLFSNFHQNVAKMSFLRENITFSAKGMFGLDIKPALPIHSFVYEV